MRCGVRILQRSPRAFSTATVQRPSGKLYICGTGESNKLGLGDTKDREVPVLVDGLQVCWPGSCPFLFFSAARSSNLLVAPATIDTVANTTNAVTTAK